MKSSRSLHPLSLLCVLVCLFTLALYAYPTVATVAESGSVEAAVEQVRAGDAVEEAWERAREASSYRYTADIVQTTIPLPTVTNIGRASKQDTLRIEGETNLPDRTMHMTLWSQGGSVMHAETGVEVRVEDDRAFARQGVGSWEEINDFTAFFAPQGDFMAFLSAAKDIADQGAEARAGVAFTRYTFRVDGLGYATYLRDQIQQHLTENGELPPGVDLDLSRQYVDMTGEGELWVGSDGLPLRQILHLDMPERPDVRITAEVTVDFSDFGFAQQVAEAGGGGETGSGGEKKTSGLGALTGSLRSLAGDHSERMLQQAALFTSTLAFILLLALNARSRKLYVALALALVTSMVFTPLLQSLQAASFSERQAERAQEQAAREEESEMIRTLRDLQTVTSAPPGLPMQGQDREFGDPLRADGARVSLVTAATDEGVSNCADDDGTDSDKDGLTDCQEGLLGTDPNSVDSDGDTITDTLEVVGFVFTPTVGSPTTYYADPLEVDTNKDGIGDGQEWNLPGSAHATWDTDGDDVPDLFDRDNDGDGVPDALDLSPHQTTTPTRIFSEDNPFSLIVNNLTSDKPTYVEFQLRPTDPEHLWYAFNVLDWPEDRHGQVQDADGKTFYDVDPDTTISPNDNGDLKLIPMLEIRITGSRTNLASPDELDHYGVSVHPLQADGAEVAAYVPLHLITDDQGDARVAFYGKMLYRPEVSWGNAQQVRMVWMVQALVDQCAADGYVDGRCVTYSAYNQTQVLHTYDDEWYLTGLNVREDHGVEVAFVYDDPAVDTDPHDDAPLVALSHGLDYSFLAGRDDEGDGQRDITVAEIYRRFNHATNGDVAADRWGIADTLSVETKFYEYTDVAQATIPMTDTKELLERAFGDPPSAPITPTVLFAREERYRTINLEVQDDGNNIWWNGHRLTVDLPGSGEDGIPVQTLAGVNWAPYQYRAGWEACGIDEYWEELSRRQPFDGGGDPDEAEGLLLGLQLYYLALYKGANSIVQLGDNLLPTETAEWDQPSWLEPGSKGLQKVVEGIYDVAKDYPGRTFKWSELAKVVKKKSLGYLKSKFKWLKWQGAGKGRKALIIGMAVYALATVTFGILGYGLGYEWAQQTVGVLVAVASFAMSVVGPIKTAISCFKGLSKAGRALGTASKILKSATKAIKGATSWAAAIGLVIEIGVIWVSFFIQASKMAFGSIEFNQLLAYAIAATILAVLMFILSATVVGAIIVAIFALLDTLLSIFAGFSITDEVAKFLASQIYSVEVLVDSDVQMGELDISWGDASRGFSAGNTLGYATNMTTTITNKDPSWSNWKIVPYMSMFYTPHRLRRTTFQYRLNQRESLVPTYQGQMYYAWRDVTFDHEHWTGKDMYRGWAPSGEIVLDQRITLKAGLNRKMPLYLNTGYAMPAAECFAIPLCIIFFCIPIPICYHGGVDGTSSTDIGEYMVYDVFPATLDEFYAWAWDPSLKTRPDADGDGLLSSAYGGPDPDDAQWDIDDDGLSDAYELQLREAGTPADPEKKDTDGDGLCDDLEVRLGTDLADIDTDNDELEDGEEVFHQDCSSGVWTGGWDFTYAADHTTRATSDPLNRDTDGDGIDDLAEKNLHLSNFEEYPFHPKVWNPSPIGLYTDLGDEDGFVHPGQTFPYTATVRNNFSTPLYAHGDMVVGFPEVLGVSRNMTITGPVVRTVVVAEDEVYVGGDFGVAGGVLASNVARWDRNTDTWAPLGPSGSGVNGPVYAVAVSGDDVYVGGDFSVAGRVLASNIARWDRGDATWHALGSGMNSPVHAIAVSGDDVYVGGEGSDNLALNKAASQSSTYGGAAASRAVDGNTNGNSGYGSVSHTDIELQPWWQVDLGDSHPIDEIRLWNRTDCCGERLSDFYVFVSGTPFTSNDPTVTQAQPGVCTAYYAGTAGVNVSFTAADSDFTGDGCDLPSGRYVRVQLSGTNYLSLAEVQVYGPSIAKWNRATEAWSVLGSGLNGPIYAIAVSGDEVYVGGDLTCEVDYGVTRWTGTAWEELGCQCFCGVSGPVRAIAVSGDDVYVGGEFGSATNTGGSVSANNVAKWNRSGGTWSGLGDGVDGPVRAVAANVIKDVYVGGSFGTPAANIARWTGTAWEPLDSGVNGPVEALAASGSQVYVGGSFTQAGGADADRLAAWNDLLGRWAWPDQVFFTLFRDEEVSIMRVLTAAPSAETQLAPIDNAQRSKFNPSGYEGSWDWENRRESSLQLEAGQAPWHTAVAPLPGGEGYRMAALVGDAPASGYALRFDGANDYVNAGSQITLTNGSFTVAFWAKRDAINDYDFVVGQGPLNTNQGLHIGFRNNNAFTCAFYYNDLNTPALSDTDWHHWACSYDAGTNLRTIYRDGVQVAQDVATAHYQGSGDLYIGRTSWGTLADHFGGLIDEVRIWDVARTQAEIRADMNRALTGSELGLTAYWPFDEGSGSITYDQTANDNDGTLVGPLWDATNAPFLNNGHITVHTVNENGFSGTPVTVDDDSHAKYPAPPDIACNQNSECLVVWSEEHGDTFDVYGSIVAPDLSAGTPFSITGGVDSVRPAVASDGSDFLVAWERPGVDAGYALSFDGVDDYVEANSVASAVGAGAISFGGWVYPAPGLSRQEGVLGFHDLAGNNRNLLLYKTDRFQYYDDSTGGLASAGTFAPGQWHHAMVVIDAGNNGILYVNGVPQVSFTTAVRPDAGGLFSIGQEWDGGPLRTTDHFSGLIDEARVWNVARTQAEIRADMNQALTGSEPGLVAYWRFDSGSGITATDQTGDGNDGTLVNGPLWDADNGQIRTRQVLRTGALSGSEQWLHAGKDDRHVDMAWAGDRYIAAWEKADDGGDVWAAYVNADGTYEPRSTRSVAATGAREEWPQVAYNADIDKALVAYRTDGDTVRGRLVQAHDASNTFDVGSRDTDATLDYPRVAYDPVHASWLAAWSGTTGGGQPAVNFQALRGDEPGPALSFDGADDYVSVPDGPTLDLSTFSVGMWVKPTQIKGVHQPLIAKENSGGGSRNYGLFVVPNTMRLHFSFQDGDCATWRSYDSVGSMTINEWNHVMMTYDGSEFKLYINGALDAGSVGVVSSVCQNAEPVKIGRELSVFTPFSGLIDEVRIWNVARTQDQILADMHRALRGDEPGLVGYWPFDEGSGGTAYDRTANGNDGSLYGPTWTADRVPYTVDRAGSRQRYVWPSELSAQGISLACAMGLGRRLLWIRFDEAGPDDSPFADYSFNGNDGSCSDPTCPETGIPGQVDAVAYFDGVDDYVDLGDPALPYSTTARSMCAWAKTNTTAPGFRFIAAYGSPVTSTAMFIGLDGPTLVGGAWADDLRVPGFWDTGWHHICLTYDGATARLYADGEEQLSDSKSWPLVPSRAYIGRHVNEIGYWNGLIDDVIVFDQALTAQEVRALYDGSYAAACALTTNDAPGVGDSLYTDRLSLRWPARWMGTISTPDPVIVPVTIDADPPTSSTVTSLAQGQYVQYTPGLELVIGGIAQDAQDPIALQSGVDYVDIWLDDSGDWQRVTGAESWAFTWPVPSVEGPHTLRTRATDNVGNVFTQTIPTTVIVDSTPPDVTSEIVNYTIISPTQDRAGRWIIPLYGSVYDPPAGTAPGSGVRSVEVLMEGQEADVAGNGWQTATLTGGDWAIDYVLPLVNNEKGVMPDPTGRYEFSVRATDEVGNRTPEGLLVGIDIRVDGSAPVAAITYTGPSTSTITQTVTLNGLVTDTVGDHTTARGLAGLEIAFVPVDRDLDLGDWEDAEYYNTLDLSGPVILQRTDAAIDFDWGYGSPHSAVLTNTFSVRWEQEVTFKVGGIYRFETTNDNGIRVTVDGSPVLVAWADGWDTAHITETAVTKGPHVLRVEYYHKSPLDLQGVPVSQPAVVRFDVSLLELDLDWAEVETLDRSGVGVITSTWSHPVPAGLDGIYEIALRGRDMFDNRTDQAAWGQWQGEIDTLAPRVSIEAQLWGLSGSASARTIYTCQAEDFNLEEEGWQCPCSGSPERCTYDTPWWRTWVSDTTRLHGLTASCIVAGRREEEVTMSACDRHGRCGQDSTTPLTATVLAPAAYAPEAYIFTPTNWSLLTTTDPISVAGAAWSQGGPSPGGFWLRALTVTVDGTPIDTITWTEEVDNEPWATTWTPTADGPHRLLALVEDSDGQVTTDTYPITVTVDTLPPQIAVPAAVLTTAHRLSFGRVALTGPYTEAGGVDAIRVQTDGGEWFDAAAVDAAVWRYAWYLGEEPDGQTYNITAVITDVGGRSAQDSNPVLVDLVEPAPVTVTLAYTDGLGVLTELVPGQTIRDVVSPTLVITWTASDSADLSFYYAGWTSQQVAQVGDLSTYGTAATRRHAQDVGDVQAVYAHVVAQDTLGNRQWQTLGPIYTDITTTPDLIGDLAYHGWAESGCAQIGADRELARNASSGQALTGTQRLYMTWDADALRLAWTGADWSNDGDLFFYFDTGESGGATTAYNPYTLPMTITLPAQDGHQLEADYLIWVEDVHTVALMRWYEVTSTWDFVDPPFPVDYCRLDTTLSPPSTDLYVPFDLLGITTTTSINMVALASEEETLRLWAAMPEKNPLNSERVLNTSGEIGQVANLSYTLTQQYEWTSLGSSLCPNVGKFTDADLLVDISADPPGVEVGYLEHDLLYLTPGTPLDADLDGEPDVDLPLDTFPDLVGQDQVITYTVHYANEGTEVAPGVRVTVTASGALELSSNPLVLDLGDVGAGITATLQFTGTVDNTWVYTQSVEVDAVVADVTHGPFDWLWIQHDVDTAAPEDLEIVAPLRYIKPYTNTVRGTVYDPSGVPTITLAAQPLQAGTPFTTTCTDGTPDDGQWACVWDIGAANNRDRFRLRPLATDRFGNGPTVGDWVTLTVDASPPTITLDAASEIALQGAVLGPGEQILLTGRVEDDQQAKGAEIYVAQYREVIPVDPGDGISGTWSYALQAVGELDNELQDLSLYGVDGAGNRSAPLTRTYGVDTVPPVITVTLWVDYLPTPSPTPVLGGTVSDGGGISEMYVSVETPEGDTSWDPVAPVGEAWSYTLDPETAGIYTLWIQARDPKGNTSQEGPYRVSVGVKEVYLPVVMRNH